MTAVSDRASWNNGTIPKTYFKYEGASDLFVGRTACGLPIHSEKFAILPPQFRKGNEAAVQNAIELCFPWMPTNMTGVLEHCLASVAYHYDYLRAELDPNHPLWSSSLFQPEALFHVLKQQVKCVLPTDVPISVWEEEIVLDNARALTNMDVPVFRSTGCPPHVTAIVYQKQLCMQVNALQGQMEQQKVQLEQVQDGPRQMKELQAVIQQQVVRMESLEGKLKEIDGKIASMCNGMKVVADRVRETAEDQSQQAIHHEQSNQSLLEVILQLDEVKRNVSDNHDAITVMLKQLLEGGRHAIQYDEQERNLGDVNRGTMSVDTECVNGDSSVDRNTSIQQANLKTIRISQVAQSLKSAWELYHFGNYVKGIPALKTLNGSKFERASSKRFTDIAYLMKCFHQFIRRSMRQISREENVEMQVMELNSFIDSRSESSIHQGKKIYEQYVENFISWLNQGEGGGTSSDRSGQLAWSTYVKKMRKKKGDDKSWLFQGCPDHEYFIA